METPSGAGKIRRPLLTLPNTTTGFISEEKTCEASPVEGLRDKRLFICAIEQAQSDRSVDKRSMTTDHVAMVLEAKSTILRELRSAETVVCQTVPVSRQGKQLQSDLLDRTEQAKLQVKKEIRGLKIQNPFLERMFNFELSWRKNKDFLKLLIDDNRVYDSRGMYVRHARRLVRRYENSTVGGKAMTGSTLRMIAYLVAVKAVEDDAVWDADFLDTYPELAASADIKLAKRGPAFTLEKILELERDFLRVIDWNTHVRFKKK